MEITDLMSQSTPLTSAPSIDNPREAYTAAIDKMVDSVEAIARERFNERSSTAISPQILNSKKVVIIGAGGLGNWQWKTLLGMGFTCITIMDDDIVSPENVGPQAHRMIDICMKKVDAIAQEAYAYKGVRIRAVDRRCPSMYAQLTAMLGFVPDIVIGCTDNREWRNAFLRSITNISTNGKEAPELWIDLRMSMGSWDCYTIPVRALVKRSETAASDMRELLNEYYKVANVSEFEAIQEPCTARSICFTGESVAAHVGALLFNWYKLPKDTRDDYRFLQLFMRGKWASGSDYPDLPDCLRYHVQCDSLRTEYAEPKAARDLQYQVAHLTDNLHYLFLHDAEYLNRCTYDEVRQAVRGMSNGVISCVPPAACDGDEKYFYFIAHYNAFCIHIPYVSGVIDNVDCMVRSDGTIINMEKLAPAEHTIVIPIKKCLFKAKYPSHFLTLYDEIPGRKFYFNEDNVLCTKVRGEEHEVTFDNGSFLLEPEAVPVVAEIAQEQSLPQQEVAVQDLNIGDHALDDDNHEFEVVDIPVPTTVIVRYIGDTKTCKMQGSIKCKICSASLTRDSNTES